MVEGGTFHEGRMGFKMTMVRSKSPLFDLGLFGTFSKWPKIYMADINGG